MSTASSLALAISARLETIRTANGFATEVGRLVFRGKRRLAEEDPPCTVLLEGDDVNETGDTGPARVVDVKLRQRYVVEAHDECDPDNPNDKAHLILADLKKAIFTLDVRELPGGVQKLRYVGRRIGVPSEGGNTTFAAVEFDLVFAEKLDNP